MEVCQLVTNREANTSIAEYLSRSGDKTYANRLQKLQLIYSPNKQNDRYMEELLLMLDLPDMGLLPAIASSDDPIEPLNTSLIEHSAEQHGWCKRICREIRQRIMGRGIGQ